MTRSIGRGLAALVVLAVGQPLTAQSFPGAAPAAQAGFGNAMAVGPDAVFIGEANNVINPGLVYVYTRGADGWAATGRLTASDGARGNGFGAALALDGATLAVSAPGAADGRGSVYVFTRSGAAWSEAARIAPAAPGEGEAFGAALALSGSVALVGAPEHADRTGAVYVYNRAADGSWTAGPMLMAEGGQTNDRFGSAVAVRGDLALVGAPNQGGGAGTVYVFRRSGATWTQAGQLAANDRGRADRFGSTVALSNGMAYVGAPQHGSNVGAVFTFAPGEAGAWEEAGRLMPFDATRNMTFGDALAVSEAGLWVGAQRADAGRGAAYVHYRDETGSWGGVVRMQLGDDRARFGANVATAGDVAVVAMAGGDNGTGTAAIYERNAATGVWELAAEVAGEMESFPIITGDPAPCTGGQASGFSCGNFDLVSFLPVSAVGGERGIGMNDVWGWTDSQTGKEYVLAGRTNGVAVVDISDPVNPVFVADLPKTPGAPSPAWRDVKVYQDHAYVVADASGDHGMQVFDLAHVRGLTDVPVTLEPVTVYREIASAHNIVINEETGFAYSVGSSSGGETCGGGLHMIDIRDPKNPTFAGCFADPQTGRASTGYSHDAQCLVYRGPDEDYQGDEICFGANETALSIANVTDKENPVAISRVSYPNVAYSHQGWISEDHRWFYLDDELDEMNTEMPGTRTLVWDISDLDDPRLANEYFGTTRASDHNLYIVGNLMYQSNYVSGLRVLDISDPANPREVGHFDTVPYGEDVPSFGGSWSNYPFFASGIIAVTSGAEGLFLVKKKDTVVF